MHTMFRKECISCAFSIHKRTMHFSATFGGTFLFWCTKEDKDVTVLPTLLHQKLRHTTLTPTGFLVSPIGFWTTALKPSCFFGAIGDHIWKKRWHWAIASYQLAGLVNKVHTCNSHINWDTHFRQMANRLRQNVLNGSQLLRVSFSSTHRLTIS